MNREINIDGMIGPTHHFGGLGVGNIASLASQNQVSNPRAAALEGLAKMELVAGMGIGQYYLPPLERPNWKWLEAVGFSGDRGDLLKRCFDEAPTILSAAYSSAFMWMANAATTAPSSDTLDGNLHLVPANLCSNLHRGQEAEGRRDQLRTAFCRVVDSQVDGPLPSVHTLRDEGAANHMRLCGKDGMNAIHVFVHGPGDEVKLTKFPRYSEMAARRVAGCLRLRKEDCVFVSQSSAAIDAGVFHNDVIAMSNENVMIYHERAFENGESQVDLIRGRFFSKTGERLFALQVLEAEVSLDEAVKTYLFNSQLVTVDQQGMELICPAQCRDSASVSELINRWVADNSNPISQVRFLSLEQSMKNGGGPACLRLRISLNSDQLSSIENQFKLTELRLERLRLEVERLYPKTLNQNDLVRLEFAEHAIATSRAIKGII